VLEELRSREPIFHRPELGKTRADFESMTEADFWEIGASGRRYSREYVLDVLEDRYKSGNPTEDGWEAADFHCRELASDVYLLTYTLSQGERKTRRATIWRRSGQGWKIVFHQGTLVQEESGRAPQQGAERAAGPPSTCLEQKQQLPNE
jgi:hypothetical protein